MTVAIKMVSNGGVWKVVAISLLSVMTTAVIVVARNSSTITIKYGEKIAKLETANEFIREDIADLKETSDTILGILMENNKEN